MRTPRRRSTPPSPMSASPSAVKGIAGAPSVLVDGRLSMLETGEVWTPFTPVFGDTCVEPPGLETIGLIAPVPVLGGVWTPRTAWPPFPLPLLPVSLLPPTVVEELHDVMPPLTLAIRRPWSL